MDELVIIGAGAHARVVAEAAELQYRYKLLRFVDDRLEPGVNGTLMGYDVCPDLPDIDGATHFIVALGDNRLRAGKFAVAISAGYRPASIVHPSAVVSPRAKIAPGSFIGAGAIIGVDASIGQNVIVNTAASIDHDCVVEAHGHIAVGVRLAGTCTVREGALLGAGSVMIPRSIVGSWSIVGAGAVVIGEIEPDCVAVGAPARKIK